MIKNFLFNFIVGFWDKFIILCGVLCALLPTTPMNMPSIGRDEGVFLYIGWRILNGELPYRDVWDHKPPIIFYINALGLAIANNSRWGVWLIEFVFLFFASFLAFHIIRKAFGSYPAVISLLLFLLTLVFVIGDGNLSEEYALPLQFAALWLVYDIDKPDFSKKQYFLIGLTGAVAFFLKQTTIGIWIAILIYITYRRLSSHQVKRWLYELLIIFIGCFVIGASILIFFSIQGAFPQFLSAAFTYNFNYSKALHGIGNRLSPIIDSINLLMKIGLLQFSMIGYLIAVIFILNKKNIVKNQKTILAIGIIALPIEFILLSTSGRTYSQYYTSILPILTLFAGFLFWLFISSLSQWGINKIGNFIFVIGVFLIILWSGFSDYYNQIRDFKYSGNASSSNNAIVINYLKQSTSTYDNILLWGAESSINFEARRRSPTRFVYQYPLYQQGYVNEQMIIEFLDEVILNCPKFIIDTKNEETPMYNFPIQTEAIEARITYLQSHYHPLEDIIKNNTESWIVYERVDSTRKCNFEG